MSSFFTLSTSQRKRKREDGTRAYSAKKKPVPTIVSKPGKAKSIKPSPDESISSGGSEAEREADGNNAGGAFSSSESEDGDETGAERRLRLAEQYLKNIRSEVQEVGFDAEEIDRNLIAERLQEDVVGTNLLSSTISGQ